MSGVGLSWRTLLEDHGGERRALSLEAIDRERVVPSFYLVLYGLSSQEKLVVWSSSTCSFHALCSSFIVEEGGEEERPLSEP